MPTVFPAGVSRLQRRVGYYVLLISALILTYSVVYHYGMHVFEGRSNTYLQSLQFTVETFTATGYGSQAGWSSPQMNLLVIVMDLTGVGVFFLALPVLLFPLFEEALSTSPPDALEEPLEDHVLVCSYTARAETLISELESNDVDYVLVEADREQATELYEGGYSVVHADPESVGGLDRAGIGDARALVADVSDRVDASIVLAAREAAEDVRIVSVVEEPDRTPYHRLAGADTVVSPRQLLGRSLAGKVTTAVTTDLGDAVEIGEDFDLAELPVHHGSELAGRTLADSGIRERFGVNVVGAWFRGEFESPPSPDRTLESGTVLLVTGDESQLERCKELTVGDLRRFRTGETVVVGYGEVGRTVAARLDRAGLSYTVLDRREKDGVDVVGEATDPDVLAEAGVEDAESVILALPDDTQTEFATLVVRDLTDDAEIIARAEEVGAVRKTYRAGADYVLSLATVSGRMVASEVLQDEAIVSMDTHVEVVRTAAPGLVGETLAGARVRERTGCTVVAVERDGEVLSELSPEFRVRESDELVVAGTDEGTNRFLELLG
ncbi:TrkA family potassium uptake protein [Natronomonas salina]|uniref:potassium channel family protein n=1 Tax=Natronomonas salina TaxID=1710540 RepID=UPI0015B60048|nr:NAD-binding protein [Natronomonas salina]QLD90059.1 TrkA family potassium uptake protein [Natronomonas salina]